MLLLNILAWNLHFTASWEDGLKLEQVIIVKYHNMKIEETKENVYVQRFYVVGQHHCKK